MAHKAKAQKPVESEQASSSRWLGNLPATERPILLLRGLALLLVVILHWFDRSTSGVLFPVPQMALVMVGYSGFLFLLMRYIRWLQKPLNYLAIDTVVATVAVYVTGGYHSSFFVLYVFITIGAAFELELMRTVMVTLIIGLIYVGACYVNPAGLESPYAQYILSAKLLLLLVVAVLCGLLLEQLRRERLETERERALTLRLRALNDLFRELNTTLDFEHTLQTVAKAPKSLLGADLTLIALLDEDGQHLSVTAADGIDAALLAEQRWPVDDALVSAILSGRQPYVIDEPPLHLDLLPGILAKQPGTKPIAALVSVPLLLADEPLGDLDVAYSRPRTFNDQDLAFLQALGQEAALAIRNARLYEREREQVARLRALDRLQESFVSSVSHELRTPLTCVKTSVDLIQATSAGLTEEQVDLIRTISHHVNRLEALVSDLLEMTKLEAGQVTLSRQPTDMAHFVRRIVEGLHPLVDRKNQTISLDCVDAIRPMEVDRRRIEQVLTNILSNAVKFTQKEGQIHVSVSDLPEGLEVCVADNGPGIPVEAQPRVFDKFYVVTDDRGLAGVGLGLYIARQLVELHGGRIWVESQPGRGSTFCFTVPRTSEEPR
jgi:signal transduction histidine kinase